MYVGVDHLLNPPPSNHSQGKYPGHKHGGKTMKFRVNKVSQSAKKDDAGVLKNQHLRNLQCSIASTGGVVNKSAMLPVNLVWEITATSPAPVVGQVIEAEGTIRTEQVQLLDVDTNQLVTKTVQWFEPA